MNSYSALIVLAPLLGAFFAGIAAWVESRITYAIALTAMGVSTACAGSVLCDVLASGSVQYRMAGWAPPMGIEFRIDALNAMVLLLISAIAFLNLVASFKNVEKETPDRAPAFYVMYLLFVVGLLGVSATGDLFNLYVLIEITSLSSYTLIALGDKDRSPVASLNYVFIGVIGASFYLLGVGYIYIKTGTLNMVDAAAIMKTMTDSSAILVAFILCILGIFIKMALFPLHVWLPNAYSSAPVGFARVVAPLMTKVMVYVMVRLMLTVFGFDYIFDTLHMSEFIVWLGTLAILAGSAMALYQKNLKRMLTYIIVCEIGYMVGGAWLGNQMGMSGAILHILNDAIMTFALFLCVGNMVYRLDTVDYTDLKGLFAKMPWTMAGFVLAAFSIVGVPPTCGFFSKWYLVLGAFEAGAYHFAAALIISSLLCAILFFKVFEICFFEPMSEGHGHGHNSPDAPAGAMAEAPVSSLVVLGLVCLSLIVVGLYSGTIVDTLIIPIVEISLT